MRCHRLLGMSGNPKTMHCGILLTHPILFLHVNNNKAFPPSLAAQYKENCHSEINVWGPLINNYCIYKTSALSIFSAKKVNEKEICPRNIFTNIHVNRTILTQFAISIKLLFGGCDFTESVCTNCHFISSNIFRLFFSLV